MSHVRSMNAGLLGLSIAGSVPSVLREVERAMRASKGSVRDAAAALGVHEGSLSRWLRLPQLAKAAALRQGREAIGKRSRKVSRKDRRP